MISSEFVDPNLTWKKHVTKFWNGVYFFEGKLQGGIEYYSKESIDLFTTNPWPYRLEMNLSKLMLERLKITVLSFHLILWF